MSVDLPAPLAPTRPVTPSPTLRSRSSSAVTPGYDLVRPAVSMTPTRPTYPGDVPTAASSAEDDQAPVSGESDELRRPRDNRGHREDSGRAGAEETTVAAVV